MKFNSDLVTFFEFQPSGCWSETMFLLLSRICYAVVSEAKVFLVAVSWFRSCGYWSETGFDCWAVVADAGFYPFLGHSCKTLLRDTFEKKKLVQAPFEDTFVGYFCKDTVTKHSCKTLFEGTLLRQSRKTLSETLLQCMLLGHSCWML